MKLRVSIIYFIFSFFIVHLGVLLVSMPKLYIIGILLIFIIITFVPNTIYFGFFKFTELVKIFIGSLASIFALIFFIKL